MGYLFLFIALAAGVAKGYCGKRTSGYTSSFRDAILATFIRMCICSVFGFLFVILMGDLDALMPTKEMLLVALLTGASTAVLLVMWLMCARRSAYMMLDIVMMLGMLIPLVSSRIFFSEAISPFQWLGMAVLFVAVIIMCSYNNSIKTKLTLSSILFLLIAGATNGLVDFSQKLFTKTVPDGSAAVFNFYSYVITAVILAFAFLVINKFAPPQEEKAQIKKILPFISVMAVCLFLNSYFKTLAAQYLDAVLLYPLNQGCGMIFSAIMAALFFKEKFTLKAAIGIITAFAGLLIINFS